MQFRSHAKARRRRGTEVSASRNYSEGRPRMTRISRMNGDERRFRMHCVRSPNSDGRPPVAHGVNSLSIRVIRAIRGRFNCMDTAKLQRCSWSLGSTRALACWPGRPRPGRGASPFTNGQGSTGPMRTARARALPLSRELETTNEHEWTRMRRTHGVLDCGGPVEEKRCRRCALPPQSE
jgi:hypothetical protein